MSAIADLFPGYFAMVMATGIVSVAAFLMDMSAIAWALLVINIFAYLVLLSMTVVRVVRYFSRIADDFSDSARGPGFFTLIAGTCVLGSQLLIVAEWERAAFVLWLFGGVLWAVIMYWFFARATVKEHKPPIEKGISGSWLIAAVSTQSISVLGTLLSPGYDAHHEHILFFTTSMFLIGCMLYLLLITLIFYRFTFFEFTTAALAPPYWINMGAVAITTLAGARLIVAAPGSALLNELIPFLKGFTLFFWAAGTWWIPLLVVLGVWRHVFKRYPVKYDPQYWGLVFPLGMYTVCTFQLSKALAFEPLMSIPMVFIYFALLGWLLAFVGLVRQILFGSRTAPA